MQGYLYSVFSALAIVIHLTINAKLLTGHGEASERGASYRRFLMGVLAYYVADAAWGVFAGLRWIDAWYADTILFFLSLVAFAFMWCRFVITYVGFGKWPARILSGCGYALLAANVVSLVANVFNGCVFGFDADGTYVVGTMRDPLFYFLIAFSLMMTLFVFVKALGSHGSERSRNMIVFVNCLTMTAAVTLQIIWPLTPFTALGCLIGNCFLHVFVVEDEHTAKHMRELETALERARTAEKARSMFFSIVSHDIRTPLNAILGYSELLQDGKASDAERNEALKSIRASGITLLQLVNDVLDLAKMDAGKMTLSPAPMSLTQLTDEVFSSFSLAAREKGIELISRISDVPILTLDEHRFRQILFNLVGNAIKFTERGSVTVEAKYADDKLEVSVADTGCGIAPDMLARILDPFVQVEDPTHSHARNMGTGLGLSICRSLIEVMGGELIVKSEPWKGSKFTAVIPGVKAVGGKALAESASEPTAELRRIPRHVLVVDDSPVNRSVLKAFLRKTGVEVVDFAADGLEALAKLRSAVQDGRPFDFVFTDYWMPHMNGVEFIEKLRADSKIAKVPVFAITADTECNTDARFKLFTGILFKPLTYGKLVEVFHSMR